MPRTFTSTAETSMLSRETGETWVVLATISHADMPSPIRVALASEDVESNGETFSACFFDVHWVPQVQGQVPRINMSIDNIDQSIIAALRVLASAPNVQLDLILLSDPNTIERSTGARYTLEDIDYDVFSINGAISLANIIGEGFPGILIAPSTTPGGF